MTALLSLHYLPCIEYFACMLKYDKILLEACENYIKQSYRNRCYIKTSQRIETLIVPVCRGNSKISIQEIEIDYDQLWVKNHWRSIQSAYGKSPFFEHYSGLFSEIYEKQHLHLYDLNFDLLTLCLNLLGLEVNMSHTNIYEKNPLLPIKDFRSVIHPKKTYEKNGLLEPCIYNQVFGNNFATNMSIIDLLFCEGPNARHILLQSIIGK